jgi:Rps23 Pro-64 3,4-dihydroxylase Tpa1-like proline 4-hydroxylase
MSDVPDIDALIVRLDRVQRVSDSRLRLTAAEVEALLDLREGSLSRDAFRFAWRNFVCLRETDPDTGYWTVVNRHDAVAAPGGETPYHPQLAFMVEDIQPLTAKYRLVPNVLPAGLADQFLDYAIGREADFSRGMTSGGVSAVRTSMLLRAFPEFDQLVRNALMPHVASSIVAFGLPRLPQIRLETYLNAYPDGTFYRQHTDHADNLIRTRVLSFVYFLFRRPAGFTGGELVLYDVCRNLMEHRLEQAAVIAPVHNAVALFPSYVPHEVLTVRSPSAAFADCRFAVTGWVHPAELPTVPA